MAAPSAREQAPGSTRTLLREVDGGLVRRTVLPGGLRVVTEAMPSVRSVAFGVWVGVGSRDETRAQTGAAHYLEHLLFKGTRRRTALEISAAVDEVGGELNAFTSKEYTCFYARVLDGDLPLAVDVVGDVVTAALIDAADVDSERGVILEEIAMNDDDPADLVHERFTAVLFGDSPLGRPILGTPESIASISRRAVHGFYRRHYRAPAMVVAAAGNLRHEDVVAEARRVFDAAGLLAADAAPLPPRVAAAPARAARGARARVHTEHRRTEQAHVVLGVPGLVRTDPRRHALGVLNAAVGGGMSSRLFQEVREKRGLAYSVYSFTAGYADAGQLGVYAGCQPARVGQVLDLVRTELSDVAARGITAEELQRGKGQLRGQLVLGLEDTGSRMARVAKAELVDTELLSVDDLLGRIDAVTPADVHQLAAELLGAPERLAVIGPEGMPAVS